MSFAQTLLPKKHSDFPEFKGIEKEEAPKIDTTDWQTGTGWETHIGFVHLFIVGPGTKQMFPVTQAYYSGQVGSDLERAAAKKAVEKLNKHHAEDRDMTGDRVRAIYEQIKRKEREP